MHMMTRGLRRNGSEPSMVFLGLGFANRPRRAFGMCAVDQWGTPIFQSSRHFSRRPHYFPHCPHWAAGSIVPLLHFTGQLWSTGSELGGGCFETPESACSPI